MTVYSTGSWAGPTRRPSKVLRGWRLAGATFLAVLCYGSGLGMVALGIALASR